MEHFLGIRDSKSRTTQYIVNQIRGEIIVNNDIASNGYMMATPLQDVTGEYLYALCSLAAGTVTIYFLGEEAPLDSFTLAEYLEIVSAGRLDPESQRLVINW